MSKPNVTKMFKAVSTALTKHSPEILTGIGIAGMITTTVLAVKATPKALRLIEEAEYAKEEKVPGTTRKLTPMETVKVAWKPYIPAAVTGVCSVACLVGGSTVSAKRNAALATAYQLSTTALNDYKDAVVKTVGEETAKEVRDTVVKTKTESINNSQTPIVIADGGNVLMIEPISNNEFRSSINKIEKAVNDLNGRMIDGMEMEISFNEFLIELHLPQSPIGDSIGWNVDNRIDLTFELSTTKAGEPCFELAYLQPPVHDYRYHY